MSARDLLLDLLSMLRRPRIWGLMWVHLCLNYIYFVTLAWTPFYLRTQLGASMETTAILSTLPHIGMAGENPHALSAVALSKGGPGDESSGRWTNSQGVRKTGHSYAKYDALAHTCDCPCLSTAQSTQCPKHPTFVMTIFLNQLLYLIYTTSGLSSCQFGTFKYTNLLRYACLMTPLATCDLQ